jgi:hypothetical protein
VHRGGDSLEAAWTAMQIVVYSLRDGRRNRHRTRGAGGWLLADPIARFWARDTGQLTRYIRRNRIAAVAFVAVGVILVVLGTA